VRKKYVFKRFKRFLKHLLPFPFSFGQTVNENEMVGALYTPLGAHLLQFAYELAQHQILIDLS
jgi:hypothetical protein